MVLCRRSASQDHESGRIEAECPFKFKNSITSEAMNISASVRVEGGQRPENRGRKNGPCKVQRATDYCFPIKNWSLVPRPERMSSKSILIGVVRNDVGIGSLDLASTWHGKAHCGSRTLLRGHGTVCLGKVLGNVQGRNFADQNDPD